MFSLAQAAKTLVLAAIIVAVFFPWNISSFVAMPLSLSVLADILFFLLKAVLVLFFAVTLVRVAMARFRINDLVSFNWVYLSVIGLAGLVLLMADVAVGPLLGVWL